MSGFQFVGGVSGNRAVKLTTTNATVIVDAPDRAMRVVHACFAEITGATPALSVFLTDGTTIYYLRNALAMTAKQLLVFDAGYHLDKGWSLKATAGAADQIDAIALVVEPVLAQQEFNSRR